MPDRIEVLCITKSNLYGPHERILNIGGKNADGTRWHLSHRDAIAGVKQNKWEFYVTKDGHKVRVVVALSRYGHDYLKTETDADQPDNLLRLPECP